MATTDLILRLQGEAQDLRDSLTKTSAGLKKIQDEIDKLSKKGSKAGKKLGDSFVKASNRIKRAFTGMAGQLTAVLGVAGIAGVFVKATKAAADFEFEMKKVETLFRGDAKKAVGEFSTEILKMAKRTGETTTNLSKGLFDIISASVKGAKDFKGATGLLTVASKAAIGGFTDTATAVDVLTTLLNSYGASADQAGEFSDKLVTIAREGKTTFGELAPELGKIAAVANGAGVSFDEVGAAIIALTKSGRSARFAMTDLRAMMTSILKPNKQMNELIKDMGFESGAAALEQVGLVGVMRALNKETGGSAGELVKFIPQVEAIAGASILAGDGIETFAGQLGPNGKLRGAIGSTDEAFDKMSQTVKFKMRQAMATLEEVFIKLGNDLLPIVLEKLEAFSEWADENGEDIKDTFVAIAEAIAAFGDFLISHGERLITILASIFAIGRIVAFQRMLKQTGSTMLGFGKKVAAAFIVIEGASGFQDVIDEIAGKSERDDKVQTELKKIAQANRIEQAKNLFNVLANVGRSAALLAGPMGPDIPEGLRTERGAGQQKKLSDAQKEALKRRLKSREMAAKRIRDLEIAGMEEIERIRAKMNDRFDKIEANKDTTRSQKIIERKLVQAAAQKKIDAVEEKQVDKIIKIEEKAAKERAADEEKSRKNSIEVAKKGLDAARTTFEIRQEAAREEIRLADEAAAKRLANIQKWKDLVLGTLKDAGMAVLGEMDNLFGGIFDRVKQQLRQIVKQAIEAAAEGEKLLILTDEERARLERDRGRPLTGSEARQLATAMSPQELANLQAQGRIGAFERVGTETPANRMQVVLDKMVSFWQNLAQNLGPIIDWLTNVAVPSIVNAFIKALPGIVKTLNKSFVDAIPKIIDLIVDNLPVVLEMIPTIIQSTIQGIVEGIKRFIERLPDIAKMIMRFLVDDLLMWVDTIGTIIFEAIPDFISALIEQTPALVAEIVKSLFTELLPGLFMALVDAIKKGLKGMLGGPFDDSTEGKQFNAGLGVLTGGISTFFHDGGMIRDAFKAHQGMFVSPRLSADEVPIIAQVGEAVLNRQAVQNAGGEAGVNAMNRGGSGGVTINNILQPQHLLSADTAKVLDDMIGKNIAAGVGQVAAAIAGDDVAGFNSRR